jgi:hypothetical protein
MVELIQVKQRDPIADHLTVIETHTADAVIAARKRGELCSREARQATMNATACFATLASRARAWERVESKPDTEVTEERRARALNDYIDGLVQVEDAVNAWGDVETRPAQRGRINGIRARLKGIRGMLYTAGMTPEEGE